jgi:hypothetical protein
MHPHNTVMPSSDVNARSGRTAIRFRVTPELFNKVYEIFHTLNNNNPNRGFRNSFPDIYNALTPTELVVRNPDIVKEALFAEQFLTQVQGIFTTSQTGTPSGLNSLELTYIPTYRLNKPNSPQPSEPEQKMLDYFNRNVNDTRFGVDVSPISSGFKVAPSPPKEGFITSEVARRMVMLLKNMIICSPAQRT